MSCHFNHPTSSVQVKSSGQGGRKQESLIRNSLKCGMSHEDTRPPITPDYCESLQQSKMIAEKKLFISQSGEK